MFGSHAILVTVLAGAVAGGTSILFAALGEVISERAGVINVGTEGTMLVGCLAAFVTDVQTGNAWLGALAGIAAGAALAGVHAWMVVYRNASQLATGLAVMFLALGITSLYGAPYVSSNITGFVQVKVPLLGDIPVLGPMLFDHDALVYVSYGLVPATWWLLFRTRWGLLIRTAGERPEALRAYGVSPARVRTVAVVLGGGFAGLGGAQLSTALSLTWSESMTAGRGFIAVALVIFAAWNPIRALLGAWLFGAAITLGNVLQAHGYHVNQFVLDALPYVLTLAVLVLLLRRQRQFAPEALGQGV
ncbi:MAG: ral nucleoside transport system permease protein [Gaiellaceae bacterium]|jgi:simple sugar transport system permease protein|nr:ral nucleoside transport system permease protein [Gaiellaceae bacterium]